MRPSVRLSAICLLLAVVIEMVSLLWQHPLSFVFFVVVGGFLLLAGVALSLPLLLGGPRKVDGA